MVLKTKQAVLRIFGTKIDCSPWPKLIVYQDQNPIKMTIKIDDQSTKLNQLNPAIEENIKDERKCIFFEEWNLQDILLDYLGEDYPIGNVN